MPLLKTLALISFYSYVAALFVLGTAGLFAPNQELTALYSVRFDATGADPMDQRDQLVLLHQYRFLKGLAIGFGIFCVTFRREILAGGTHARVFLATLFLGTFGRLVSAWIDGRPPKWLISFTFSELIFGLLILAYVQAVRRIGAPAAG
ncbi:MAG TPA: DUF4345 family protein [Thermoanaerobaculia bacterium]|jgi:hypothetical protein|nr:DUF4345 family protein [Thermoanaerobaculia bacterium]